MDDLREFELEISKDKVWRVRIRGDDLQIVDELGRERHRSRGHENTGIHLAMRLAEKPFDSEQNIDDALRMAADEF